MDINLLVINVGNSRIAIGSFVKGELEHVVRINATERDKLEGAIADAWAKFEGASADVAGASVNPGLIEAVEHAVKQATGQTIDWVGEGIDLPMKVKTDSPEKTGVDRVVTLAAAHEQMQKACVVVDAGTAVTLSVCNDAGDFLGGAIAPGAAMQLAALKQYTAKLPAVTLAVPETLIGKNTEQAMLNGVYHGIRGLVKETVENYAVELGNWPDLICTGGDAKLLFEGWELVHAISPDLTLYGIALAYTQHHIDHES